MKPTLSNAIYDYRMILSQTLEVQDVLNNGRKSLIDTDDGQRIPVFNSDDQATVDSQVGPTQKMETLIDIVVEKSEKVFEWFMCHLVGTGHGDIATDIRKAAGLSESGTLTAEAVITSMKQYYQELGGILQDTQDTSPYSLADVFVPMKWINTTANQSPDSEVQFTDYKTVLKILKDEKTVRNRIAIVTGNSGCGKTVFAQKVANDWALGNDTYKIVILVSLRQLCSVTRNTSLKFQHVSILNAAVDQFLKYPSYFPYGRSELRRVLIKYCYAQNREDVLFICDGYDEYLSGYIEQLETIKHPLVRERMDLPPLSSSLIVTSRPFYAEELNVGHRFSLLGFDEHDLPRFVASFFQDPNRQKIETNVVLKSIEQNPRLAFLVKTPMMLAMVCHTVLDADRLNQQSIYHLISTKASLYQCYCDYLVRRMNSQRIQVAHDQTDYNKIEKFDDIPGKESLFKTCYLYLSSEVRLESITHWTNSMISSVWFKMGILVGNRLALVEPQTQNQFPLAFVDRSFIAFFASKELVRMIKEDTLRDTLLLVGMRNSTSVDHLPPLYQFMHRFKRSITFRSEINQVVEFAYDVLDKQRRQALRHALMDESSIDIKDVVQSLTDLVLRQELTPHEIMLDINFKRKAHFCSIKDCQSKTNPGVIGNVDSRIDQALCCGHQSLLQLEQVETSSFKETLLFLKLEKLSLQKIKWQMLQLLRVTREHIHIVIDIDNYDQELTNQFAERLNDAIIEERNQHVPQFDEMHIEQKRRRRSAINEKTVSLYLFCSRCNAGVLNFQCWSVLENITLLSINGIKITTDEVKEIIKYSDRENNRYVFKLRLTRNGFSEKDYLDISTFIGQNKNVFKHSRLNPPKFDAESPISYSTVRRCFELAWQEHNYEDVFIHNDYDTSNINLTKTEKLQDLCELITSKVVNSVKNNVVNQLIDITMKRCCLDDKNIAQLNKMMESIIKAASEQKVKIERLELNLVYNMFSYTGERMLREHALKFKYEMYL